MGTIPIPPALQSRFSGEEGYFSGEGTLYQHRLWETNFVPHAGTMQLYDEKERGSGATNVQLQMAANSMGAHISQFPVGTYKKAHRHGPGAHLLILEGEGYSLFWQEGQERIKWDWRAGGMGIVPTESCFHQHFNTGAAPARYLALRHGGGRGGEPENEGGMGGANVSMKLGGWQVEYEDEDPELHRLFESELARHGATCLMKAIIPGCTGEMGPTRLGGGDD